MKTKRSKNKRIAAGVLALVLIGLVLFIANGFVGNPLSKILANRAASRDIEEKYSDLDLRVEDAYYNFKDGRYLVEARSNRSIDTHFEMSYNWRGELQYDSYEDAVESKWNTWQRINEEYSKLVENKIMPKMGLKEREFIFGNFIEKNDDLSYLEIDGVYDIKELAKSLGRVTVSLERETRNSKVMAEKLLEIKNLFDREDIPFYHIEIDLNEARSENYENQPENEEQASLMIRDFLYQDIYAENLEERVEENIKETKIFYRVEDEKKQEEIEEFEEDSK